MTTKRTRRIVIWAMSLSLLLGLAGTPGFIPSVEAASASASKRIIKKLKQQIATLQSQVAGLTQQLAIANQEPPFLEMVTVGDPGNPAGEETTVGNFFGAVATTFRIGKFEVTNAQYAEFLNAVAGDDTHELFNGQMDFDSSSLGGIRQFGTSPNFRYATKIAMADKPVNYVNWFDAARFCNWLHNGRPVGAQNASTTETGAYALNGATSGVGIAREATAEFWLPNADEWHKAAYHQPASQGGDTDSYWLYPTGSNTIPTVATVNAIGEITNDNGNLANYASGADWNGQDGNLTTVGSGGAGSASHYGAFDMGGNVEEWTDFAEATFRFVLGGTFFSTESAMRASERGRRDPVVHFPDLGFRVAGRVE
jgi:formylglycine-generating enzyme